MALKSGSPLAGQIRLGVSHENRASPSEGGQAEPCQGNTLTWLPGAGP